MITKTAEAYADVADKHATEFLPYGTAYLDEGTYVDPYNAPEKQSAWVFLFHPPITLYNYFRMKCSLKHTYIKIISLSNFL